MAVEINGQGGRGWKVGSVGNTDAACFKVVGRSRGLTGTRLRDRQISFPQSLVVPPILPIPGHSRQRILHKKDYRGWPQGNVCE